MNFLYHETQCEIEKRTIVRSLKFIVIHNFEDMNFRNVQLIFIFGTDGEQI